jgi:SAM-dependent methyltransferase
VASLPFMHGTFDAVWCSNVLQYLNEDDAKRALAEFRRVARPGGIVAVKEVDMGMMRIHPGNPFLVTHLAEATASRPDAVQSRGSLRGREMRRWLESAGFVDVFQKTFLIERWAPLRSVENQLFREWLAYLASVAAEVDLPEGDAAEWHRYADSAASLHPVEASDFYACEGQVVTVGRVRD